MKPVPRSRVWQNLESAELPDIAHVADTRTRAEHARITRPPEASTTKVLVVLIAPIANAAEPAIGENPIARFGDAQELRPFEAPHRRLAI
jgi:hypothetical protein